MQHGNCDIKRVLIDYGSSIDILFWDVFQKLHLNPNDVKVSSGSLRGFSSEHVQVNGHVTLETTCVKGVNSKVIDVNHLIVNALLPYNIILGPPVPTSKHRPPYRWILKLPHIKLHKSIL